MLQILPALIPRKTATPRLLLWQARRYDYGLSGHFHAALGTDGKHMACALAQGRIHTGNKGIQNIVRHKSLDRSGEAAAVDTVSAPAT